MKKARKTVDKGAESREIDELINGTRAAFVWRYMPGCNYISTPSVEKAAKLAKMHRPRRQQYSKGKQDRWAIYRG